MPSIDEDAKRWQLELSERVGRAIQAARKASGWTAAELSRRTVDLGYPISRVAISKIESNSRAGKLDLGELLVLAAALNTSPATLVFPGPYNEKVAVVPGRPIHGFNAVQWFSALEWLGALVVHDGRTYKRTALDARADWDTTTREITLWRELAELERSQGAVISRGGSNQELDFYGDQIRAMRRQLGLDGDA